MAGITLAGSIFTTHGFPHHDAANWTSRAMACGAIAGRAIAEADLVLVPSLAHAEREAVPRAITPNEFARAVADHRPRHLRSAEVPVPRQSNALKGYRIAVFGGLRNVEALTACAKSLAGEIVPSPCTDVDVLVFGSGLDAVPQRLKAIRVGGRDVRCFSEPEFFDLVEPFFSPFKADTLQRQLAARLLALPPPPASPFSLGF